MEYVLHASGETQIPARVALPRLLSLQLRPQSCNTTPANKAPRHFVSTIYFPLHSRTLVYAEADRDQITSLISSHLFSQCCHRLKALGLNFEPTRRDSRKVRQGWG